MRTIFVGTDRKPFVMEFEDELQNFQSLVGGRIEVLHFHTEGSRTIDLIFNEEYRFLFDEVNRWIVYPGGEKDSLTDDEVKFYLKEFEKDTLTITH